MKRQPVTVHSEPPLPSSQMVVTSLCAYRRSLHTQWAPVGIQCASVLCGVLKVRRELCSLLISNTSCLAMKLLQGQCCVAASDRSLVYLSISWIFVTVWQIRWHTNVCFHCSHCIGADTADSLHLSELKLCCVHVGQCWEWELPPYLSLLDKPSERSSLSFSSLSCAQQDAAGQRRPSEMLLSDDDGSEKEVVLVRRNNHRRYTKWHSHALPALLILLPESQQLQQLPHRVSMATPFLWKLSSQKLGFFLVSFGFIWGMMLLHFTIQQRASHENSAVLRQQILDLSKRYIKALAEENQSVMDGPYVGTMTAYGE